MALVIHQPGFAGEADERPHVVEQLDDGEGEDDRNDAVLERAHDVELHERGGEAREGETHNAVDPGRGRGYAEYHAEHGGHKDADEQAPLDVTGHEPRREHEAATGQQRAGLGDMAKGDHCSVVLYHDARVLEPDEGDEHADADDDGILEVHGHGINEQLADVRNRQQQEHDAGEEHRTEGHGPVQAEDAADVVGEEGVQPHAGGHGHREIGPEAHGGAADDRGPDGCGNGGFLGDTRVREDARIDENDVSHSDEGGQAGEDFRFDGRSFFAQLENPFQYAFCLGHGRSPVVEWFRMIPPKTDNPCTWESWTGQVC